MSIANAFPVVSPIPGDELDAMLGLAPRQHDAVEVCQLLVFVLQPCGTQKGRQLHLRHILRHRADDFVHSVLGHFSFRGRNIIALICDTTIQQNLAQRRILPPDLYFFFRCFLHTEAFSGKDDRCFFEVAPFFIFFSAHDFPPLVLVKNMAGARWLRPVFRAQHAGALFGIEKGRRFLGRSRPTKRHPNICYSFF